MEESGRTNQSAAAAAEEEEDVHFTQSKHTNQWGAVDRVSCLDSQTQRWATCGGRFRATLVVDLLAEMTRSVLISCRPAVSDAFNLLSFTQGATSATWCILTRAATKSQPINCWSRFSIKRSQWFAAFLSHLWEDPYFSCFRFMRVGSRAMHSGSNALCFRDGASSPRLHNWISCIWSQTVKLSGWSEVRSWNCTASEHSLLSHFCDIRRGHHVGSGWAAAHKWVQLSNQVRPVCLGFGQKKQLEGWKELQLIHTFFFSSKTRPNPT